VDQSGNIKLSYKDFYFEELPKVSNFYFILQWVNQNGSLKIQKVTCQMKSLEKTSPNFYCCVCIHGFLIAKL
jgi:hypothetical protein